MSLDPMSRMMLLTFGLPFLAALIVFAVGGWLGRRGEDNASPRWAGAIALGPAYALGHAAAFDWGGRVRPWMISVRDWLKGGEDWPFSLSDAGLWVFWIAIAAAIFGLLDALWKGPWWARGQSRLILIGLTLGMVLKAKYAEVWTIRQALSWSLEMGSYAFVLGSILEGRASKIGPGMPLPLAIVAGGLAAVMILHHSLLRMFMAGALASAMAGAWVVTWWDRRLNLGRGGMPVFSAVFLALLLDAYFWQDVPKSILALLAAAPLATFVDRIGPVSRRKPWQVGLIRALAIAIPVGVAVGLAYAWRPDDIYTG